MSRLLAILALTAAIAIFFVYINPTWTGSVAETQAAITSDNQALAAAKEYKAREKALIAARDAINQADLSRLHVLLPNTVDDVGLILDLNALAMRSGLSLVGIDVSSNGAASSNATAPTAALAAVGGSSLGSLDLSLSGVGTYNAYRKFLDGVEKSARLLDVRDISITGSNTGLYTYQMTVRLYWLR